ncbi:MAG: DUF5681 domain-containing protein [Marinosulfonomonas sp.]
MGDRKTKGKGSGNLSPETIEATKKAILFGETQAMPMTTPAPKRRQGSSKETRKKLNSVDKSVLEVANSEIDIRIGGEVKTVRMQDAVTQKAFESALQGSVHGQRYVMGAISRACELERAEIDAELTLWGEFKERKYQERAEAETSGQPVPEDLPHPDDIILDLDIGVRFVGPLSDAELKEVLRVYRSAAFRMLWISRCSRRTSLTQLRLANSPMA